MNVSDYLGKPWVAMEYDCWGLVRDVYARELDIHLPRVLINARHSRLVIHEFASSKIFTRFEKLKEPQHLCVVTMASGQHMNHVGVYIETHSIPHILHNQSGSGVVCAPLYELKDKILDYYRFKQ
jgi:cell wall-associated NlpC family hydrolase